MSFLGPQGVDVTRVSTTQEYGLGDEVAIKTADGGRTDYRYVQANGAITQWQWASIDDDNQAAAGVGGVLTAPRLAGIAPVTFADNEYGWLAIGPISKSHGLKVNALASCVADVVLYTSATTGSVDDASGSQTKISSLALDTTVGGAPASTTCYSMGRLLLVG